VHIGWEGAHDKGGAGRGSRQGCGERSIVCFCSRFDRTLTPPPPHTHTSTAEMAAAKVVTKCSEASSAEKGVPMDPMTKPILDKFPESMGSKISVQVCGSIVVQLDMRTITCSFSSTEC